MKLYEIAQDYMAVIEGGMVVDEETGEVIFDGDDMARLTADLNDKLEACALYVKNLEAEATAIKNEEKALASRRRSIEAKSESMRKYISDMMTFTGTEKVETPRAKLSFRASKQMHVYDESVIPGEYLRTTTSPDKAALKKAIDIGAEIPGAMIVEKKNLQVK